MTAKLFFVCTLAALSAACSSAIDGTGAQSVDGDRPGGENTPEVDETPADIAALFDAPSGEPTPNKLGGVWAEMGASDFERRVIIAADTITLAGKRTADGRIIYVTVAARVSEQKVTVLETKWATLDSSYTNGRSLQSQRIAFAISETTRCDEYDSPTSGYCFQIEGTTLTGLFASSSYARWLKLSDL